MSFWGSCSALCRRKPEPPGPCRYWWSYWCTQCAQPTRAAHKPSLLQGCYTKQSEITTIKLKLAKEKDNQPSHLHGHIKVGGFPVFPFDEHLLGGINQEHQAVSPCNFVVSYWRWRPGLFCCHFSITFCINATCQHFTCAEVDFNNQNVIIKCDNSKSII